jgi:HEAT repeat protein
MSRFVLGSVLALLVAGPLEAQPSDAETRARVRKLIGELSDDKASVRQSAADQLGSLGTRARAAIPVLRAALGDKELSVRAFAAASLLLIDQAEVGKAMPILQSVLKESKDALPLQLFFKLGHALKPATPEMISALLKLAAEEHPLCRSLADMTLANVRDKQKDIIAVLETNLKDQNLRTRLQAARCLGRLDPKKVKQAVPVLRQGLEQKDIETRLWASEELLRLDPELKAEVVKALTPALQDKDPSVRTRVALSLIEIDEVAAKQAVPVLREALKDAGMRLSLLGTVAGVVRKQEKRFKLVQPIFEDALRDSDLNLRLEALVQVGTLGPVAEPLEKQLRDSLKDRDKAIAAGSTEALMRIAPRKAGQLLPNLLDAVESRDREAKGIKDLLLLFEKLKDLSKPEEWAGSLVEQVEKETRQARTGWHRTELMQLNAIVRLGELGPEAAKGVKALTAIVGDTSGAKKDIVRGQAALALGRIGYEARTAIPVLLKVAGDDIEPPDIRRIAREALRDIDRAKDKP